MALRDILLFSSSKCSKGKTIFVSVRFDIGKNIPYGGCFRFDKGGWLSCNSSEENSTF